MGTDQAHEQNNKVIKADGGAIGILDNESVLLLWVTSGPQISGMLSELSNNSDDDENNFQYHHEDTDAFELKFQSNRENVLAAFQEFSNPFNECESNLMNIVSKVVLGENASESARNSKLIGLPQSSTFTQEQMISRTKSLYDNIPQTKLPLFLHRAAGNITSKTRKNLKLMKDDSRLFSSFYIACQTRAGDLDNLFAHENHSFPVSISEYGNLCKCSISDFISCLTFIVLT